MKIFKFLIAAALFAVLLVSCEEATKNTPLGGEYVNATIDGESFKSVYIHEIASETGNILITATNLATNPIIINISDYKQTGTYVLDDVLTLNSISYVVDGTTYTTSGTANSANKIVVTKVSDGHIEGTFTAICTEALGEGTVTITNGEFVSDYELNPAE